MVKKHISNKRSLEYDKNAGAIFFVAFFVIILLGVMYVLKGQDISPVTGKALEVMLIGQKPDLEIVDIVVKKLPSTIPEYDTYGFDVVVKNTGAVSAQQIILQISTKKSKSYPKGYETSLKIPFIRSGEELSLSSGQFMKKVGSEEFIITQAIIDAAENIPEQSENNVFTKTLKLV